MTKIRNNQTGEVIDVPDTQLSSYGISSSPSMQDPTQPTQPAQMPQPKIPSQPIDVGSATQDTTMPSNITGHTLAEHAQALNAAKAAGDTAAIKQITDDYNRENDYQQKYILPVQSEATKVAQTKAAAAEKAAQSKSDALGTTKGTIQNLLDTYNQLPGWEKGSPLAGTIAGHLPTTGSEYESQRKSLAASLKDVAGAGAGSGVRVTQSELNGWANLMPSISKTAAQNKIDMVSLEKQLQTKFGQGLDPEYLQAFGVGNNAKQSQAPTTSTGMDIANAIGNTVKNVGQQAFGTAKNDINDIVAGIVSMHGQKALDAAAATANQLQDMAAKEQDPQKKKVLLSQANSLWQSISSQAGQEGKNFSPDVNQNPLTRAAVGATQIGTGADVLAHPVSTVKGITSPITHPIQTIKSGVNIAKDPAGALTGALKNDWEATQKGWNPFNQPAKEGVTLASGNPAVGSNTPAATTNTSSAKNNFARRISTNLLPVPDETNVTNSEKLLNKTLAMTKSNDVRGMAKELEASVPANSKAVVSHAQGLDKTVGLQPLDENLNTIIDRLSNTSAGQANPQLVDKLKTVLQNQMKAGSLGQAGAATGNLNGTNFEKMNDARTYLNSGLTNWFKNGRPEGSPTNDLNALKWEASTAIKDMMSQGDKAGVFKDLLDKQHTALQVAPVFAKSALSGGTPVTGVQSGIKKLYDATIGKAAQAGGIAGVRAMQEPIAPTLYDGTPAVKSSAEPFNVQNTAPQPGESKYAPPTEGPVTSQDTNNPNRIVIPKPDPFATGSTLNTTGIQSQISNLQKTIDDITKTGSSANGKLFSRDIPALQAQMKALQLKIK